MLENYPLNPELLNARLKAELGLGEYEQAESTMKLLEGQESASGINSHLAYLTKTDGHDRALEYARQLHEKKPEITSLLSDWMAQFVCRKVCGVHRRSFGGKEQVYHRA